MDSKKEQASWSRVGMGLVFLLFFFGSLILVNPASLYVSPDETANAYFAGSFADSGEIQGSYDDLVSDFDRIHPRSTVSIDGRLLPGSFLGLPFLYGMFEFLLGSWVLWILTPLLTMLTAYGWGRLIRRFTNPTLGTISTILFLIHPAVWYYSARGLMHNVLFLDLLVLSLWFWVDRPWMNRQKRPSVWNDLLGGLCLGLALFVRTSEIMWVGAGVVLAGIIWWRTLSWRRVRAGVFGFALGIGLLLFMNGMTYGNPFTTGYTVGAPALTELVQGETTDAIQLLPFGFHPMNAWRHFASYGVSMFWWLSLLAVPGFFLLLAQTPHQRTIRWSVGLAVVVSLWLVFMYGSWEIHDNPDPTQITMANSYVRYWLPMYLFSTPMIALTIQWMARRGRSGFARTTIVLTLLLAVIGLNVQATFLQGQDGLMKMRQELDRASAIQESVLRYTEGGSVIIVDRADKLFFPHRHVWYPLRDEATYEAMPALVEATTLYYYGITFPEEDMAYLNESRLKRMDLQIELIETYDQESLYRITTP